MFDNMIADMQSNRKLSTKVTELFLRGRKIKISLVFISQSYFKVPKTIRLNATQYLIMKIPNERELQQRASNYSSDALKSKCNTLVKFYNRLDEFKKFFYSNGTCKREKVD